MKKDPNHITTLDAYDLEGNLSDIVNRLNDILRKHPDAKVEYDLDYDSCYYEGDRPYPKFIIKSK